MFSQMTIKGQVHFEYDTWVGEQTCFMRNDLIGKRTGLKCIRVGCSHFINKNSKGKSLKLEKGEA